MKKPHQKKILAAFLAAAVLGTAAEGCKGGASVSSGSSESLNTATTINIGDQPAFFLFKVAEAQGFFTKELGSGIKVNVVSYVKQGPAVVESMAAKHVDLAMLGTLPLVTANANSKQIIALASGNYSQNGHALFANPKSGVKSVEDLKGKTVGVPFGTDLHQAAIELLEKHGLKTTDVKLTNMAATDALTALEKGNITCALLVGNNFYKAKQAGEIEIADNSETGPIASLIVGRKNFIEKNPELTQKFLKACAEAADYIENHSDESIANAAKVTGATKDDEKVNYESRIRSVNIEEEYFTDPLQRTIDFAKKQSLIGRDITVKEIADTSYFTKAGIS